MKVCSKCHKEKDLSEFYHSKRGLDGFRSICKKCDKAHHSNYIKNHKWKKILQDIKQRCNNSNNPSYKDYGKKGIQCLINEKEIQKLMIRDNYWNLNDPTIDRKDNNKDYTFENCQYIELSDNVIKESSKTTLQFTKNGDLVKEWTSAREASRTLKIDEGNLNKSLLNKRPSAGGYIWKYKELK